MKSYGAKKEEEKKKESYDARPNLLWVCQCTSAVGISLHVLHNIN